MLYTVHARRLTRSAGILLCTVLPRTSCMSGAQVSLHILFKNYIDTVEGRNIAVVVFSILFCYCTVLYKTTTVEDAALMLESWQLWYTPVLHRCYSCRLAIVEDRGTEYHHQSRRRRTCSIRCHATESRTIKMRRICSNPYHVVYYTRGEIQWKCLGKRRSTHDEQRPNTMALQRTLLYRRTFQEISKWDSSASFKRRRSTFIMSTALYHGKQVVVLQECTKTFLMGIKGVSSIPARCSEKRGTAELTTVPHS